MKWKINIELVESFKNGDENAFYEIYQSYYKRIYFYAYQHCRDEELSKDIIQNTFMEVYNSRKNLRKNDAFYSWMLRIAYCQILKNVGKEYKKRAFQMEIEDIENLLDASQNGTDKKVENKEIVKVVYRSIGDMKPVYKDVAILRYYYELSTKEIAGVLSIAIGTAKSRVFRVNKIIQKQLKEEGLAPDISKSSAIFTMFIPAFMKTVDTAISINDIANMKQSIIDSVGKTVGTIGTPLINGKWILGLAAGITISGTMYYAFHQQSIDIGIIDTTVVAKEIELENRIINVYYDMGYTCNPINISVDTINDKYDQILLNGSEDLVIKNNGIFELVLMKDGEVIDLKEIEINNLDFNSPKFSVSKYGNTYAIYLEDGESGLRYDTIQYYLNDSICYDYMLDENEDIIYFEYQEYSSNVFYVEDMVGNWREIRVTSVNI